MAELLQALGAVGGHDGGQRAEGAERREPHHPADDPEDDVGQCPEAAGQRRGLLARRVLLVPEQAVGLDGAPVLQGGGQVEAAVDVDGQPGAVAVEHVEDGLDAAQVLGRVRAADLHLHHAVAEVQEAAHLVLQVPQGHARRVVAAGGVDEDGVVGTAVAVAVGQVPVQRLLRDLRGEVEERHVHDADGHRALAVPAGLLVARHHLPRPGGIQLAPLVQEVLGGGGEQPGDDAPAQDLARAVAAVRVEAVADDRLPVTDDITDDRHDRAVHRAEVDPCVADRRADRDGALVHGGDLHGVRFSHIL
nr:hypothetical protein [Streptomyces sulfonofaciens]